MRRSLAHRLASFLDTFAVFPSRRSFFNRTSSVLLLTCVSVAVRAQAVQSFPGTTAVGSTITRPITVTVTTAGVAAAPVAVTGGVAGLDFSTVGGGGCTAGTSYAVGEQCTVLATFTPKYPGQRSGAILLQAADGTLLGSALIGGKASGALPVLIPGRIDTVAGSDLWIYDRDDIAATTARIRTPQGIVVDAAGNLILSDTGNNRIRRVDAQTQIITTIVGNGSSGFSGDGGPATAASIASPSSLALDGAGNLYFADTGNSVVRRVDAISKIISTIAGVTPTGGSQSTGSMATQTELNQPQGIALDAAGHLFIADTNNHVLRRINLATGSIVTIAGDGTPGFSGDGQLAVSARLNMPEGVFVKTDGSVLVADSVNNRVRQIDIAGFITTVVGNGAQGFGGDGGTASAATLNNPIGLAIDPVGDLYIADAGSSRVRFVDAVTGNISTLAGTVSPAFGGDGAAANLASLHGPFGVFFSQDGNLFVSDMFNMRVRSISGSKAKLDYATIRRGKVSAAQSQTLANYGDLPLQLADPALVYAQLDGPTTTCSTSAVLAPSSTCTLGIEFAPTVIGGDVVGSVTLPSNATNITPVVTIDGEVLDVNPTSVAVVSSANPSVVGGQVVFTATVTSDDAGRTGNLSFTGDGNVLCSVALGSNGTATCAVSTLTLGSHSIIVQYAGDAQNAAATSPTLTQVVKQQASFALSSSANPSVVSNAVTFTVVASAATGTPSGTVTFFDGTTNLGAVMLHNGSATLTTATLAVGSHPITVQYAGDMQNAPSTSGVLTQTVQQAATSTMLATSNADVPVGTSITLTATVTSSNGPAPTGSVTFAEGAMTYGTVSLTNGTAAVTFSSLPPGAHTITATYSGDLNSNVSTSAALVETIRQIGTSTTLSADSNPLSAGSTLHLTAQVAMAAGATASGAINGQVTFFDGSSILATVQLNGALTATLQVNALSVGTHALKATFQGNTNYAASNGSIAESVVRTATSASLSSASNPTLAGRAAVFTVAVTSSTGTPTGNVSLMEGGTVLSTATLNAHGVATFSTASLAVGAHTLTAGYVGDANYLPTTSAPVTQTVNLAATAVTLSGPSAAVNLTAAAAFSSSLTSPGVTPTGTLSLQEGTVIIATRTVTATGTFTFSSSTFSGGQHTLVAVYSGDANNAPAQSAPFVLTVQQAPTSTSLTTSGSPSVVGSNVTLTANTTSSTANLTGNVTFFDGAATLATVPLINGTASFSTTGLAFGAHTLTATYTGDTNHAASSAAALAQSIVQQAVVTVASSLNPANSGQTVIFTATVPAVAGTVPTGNVTFTGDGLATVVVALDAAGQARMQTATLAVGTHPIVATYAGDTSFAGANAMLTEIVRNAATTTSLTVSADPVAFGTPLVFTATILSNGGTATGAVSFTENGTAIGSANLAANGITSLTLSTLAPGRHNVTANYLGDGKASASTSNTVSFLVRQHTTLALGSAANPALSLNGISLTATLTNDGAAAATGSIVFSEGAAVLGTVALNANGQAKLDLPPMSVGTHALTAAYAGDDGDFPAVAPVLQQVVQQRSTTTVLTTSATNAADDQQVTLIAIVQTPTLAAGTVPTGTVTFTTGTTTVGKAPIDNTGVATLTIRLQASQTETLIATYSGDVPYSGSTSGKATVTSGPASQFVLAVSSPAIQLQSGQRTTVNLTVASVRGFNDQLKFGCVGLPYATTCSFSTVNVQLAAGGSNVLQLVIDTGDPLGEGTGVNGNASNTPNLFGNGKGAALCLLPAAALLCLFRKRRWMPALAAALILGAATLGSTGCAGLQTNSTPAGTYTFQVTALGQGTGATQAQTITLTVAK